MLTAMLLWAVYGDKINKAQWVCIVFTVTGLVCVLAPRASCDNGGEEEEVIKGSTLGSTVMFISCIITSFTSVVNAKLIQKGDVPLNVQNMMLYSQGFVMNFAAYKLNLSPSKQVSGYFAGYDNVMVMLVLLSQSLMGIAITLVFKYGGAIIKSLSVATQAAILAVLDSIMFGVAWNAQSVAGTVTVLTASYAYFSIAPKFIESPSVIADFLERQWARVVVLFVVCLLFGLASVGPALSS